MNGIGEDLELEPKLFLFAEQDLGEAFDRNLLTINLRSKLDAELSLLCWVCLRGELRDLGGKAKVGHHVDTCSVVFEHLAALGMLFRPHRRLLELLKLLLGQITYLGTFGEV